jgi:hypothetical protein
MQVWLSLDCCQIVREVEIRITTTLQETYGLIYQLALKGGGEDYWFPIYNYSDMLCIISRASAANDHGRYQANKSE